MSLERLLKQKGILGLMLAIAIICGMAPQNVGAMPVGSQPVVYQSAAQSIYLEKIQGFLNQEVVKQRLSKLGMSEEAVTAYITKLDEPKLAQLASKIDTLESAGSDALGIVLILALLFFTVLYFTEYRLKLEPRHK